MAPERVLFYGLLAACLFAAELLYFRLAVKHGIIDKPNDRSSHRRPVIRGGGVIFFLALTFWFVMEGGIWPWFMFGAALVSFISFMDDLYAQKPVVRFVLHLTAMTLLFYQVGLFNWPIWLLVLALIVCIGTVNAFNFMDGINGITGVYSLVTVGTFLYIQEYVNTFTSATLLVTLLISILVFLFFNFRRRAKCFAGDVGSVTLAFAIIFLLLQLIVGTNNLVWVLFLTVYGTDSVITIIYRISKRENIFKAHRSHLYQYLSNEMRLPHLGVSLCYGILQLMINAIVILYFKEFDVMAVMFIVTFIVSYTVLREIILKKIGQPGLFIRSVAG